MKASAVAIAFAIAVTCAPAGHADPPKFPDMSSYVPVNPQDYTVEVPNPGRPYTTPVVRFLTPDGILCAFTNTPGAGCTGNNLPGVPSAVPAPTATSGGRVNSIATDGGLNQLGVASTTEAPPPPAKNLPPFHSITVNGVVCGVDDSRTTACKDPNGQGFVLSPNGSGWLPHV